MPPPPRRASRGAPTVMVRGAMACESWTAEDVARWLSEDLKLNKYAAGFILVRRSAPPRPNTVGRRAP